VRVYEPPLQGVKASGAADVHTAVEQGRGNPPDWIRWTGEGELRNALGKPVTAMHGVGKAFTAASKKATGALRVISY